MKNIIFKIVFIFALASLIELVIINSQPLLLRFSENKNKEVTYEISNETTEEDEGEKDKIVKGSNEIVIEDLGYKVENIRIYYKQDNSNLITYLPKAKMYGHEGYYKEFNEKIMQAKKDNTYLNVRTETECDRILLDIENPEDNSIQIEKIVINSTVINFNIVRVIIMFFAILFVILIKNKKIQAIVYNKNSKKQKIIYYGTVCILLVLLSIFWSQVLFDSSESLVVKESNGENYVTQTEAFFNKSISLIEEPSKELKGLENPYDSTLRGFEIVDYLWDTSYYNGNYYQYFSILPIIFIMLPFKILTGYYITTKLVTIIFLAILIWLISFFFKKMVERYIKNISFLNLIIGMLVTILGSNILQMQRAMVYELTEIIGIICLLVTILLLISVKEKEKHKCLNIVLASICTGFMVIAKPTFISWYILIFPMLYYSIKDLDKIEKVKKFCIFSIPLIIIATGQMLYNYARYESIFEFGAKYQLTVYDMSCLMNVSIPKIIKGYMKYLVTFPSIQLETFPFIQMYDVNTVVSPTLGALTFETPVIGVFAIPIMWGIFWKKKILDLKDKKEKELNILIKIVIIISALIILENTIFAGIAEKYALQYKLILVIINCVLLLKGVEKKKISNTLFIVLCISTILLMLPISLHVPENWALDNTIPIIVEMKNLFEFWN